MFLLRVRRWGGCGGRVLCWLDCVLARVVGCCSVEEGWAMCMDSIAAVVLLYPYAVRCLRCNKYAWSARRRRMLVLEAVSSAKISGELTVTKPYFALGGIQKLTAKSDTLIVCYRYICSKDPKVLSILGSVPLTLSFTSPFTSPRTPVFTAHMHRLP